MTTLTNKRILVTGACGTIVNRFITQAVVGYPLTVYGKGGQTRGYLNIKDTLQCVHMSEKNLAKPGELRIFNQIMETFSANELAEKTKQVGDKMGYKVQIDHLENPRKEAEEHYYNPTYQGLLNIGVQPHYLTDDVMEGMFRVVENYKEKIRPHSSHSYKKVNPNTLNSRLLLGKKP